MFIAKGISKEFINSTEPNEYWLDEVEIRAYLSTSPDYISRKVGPRIAYFHINSETEIYLDVFFGRIKIYYGPKITDVILNELQKVADRLGAKIFKLNYKEYPIEKIRAAQERWAKKDIHKKKEYLKESFGVNNMWLAIKASKHDVAAYFNLSGKQSTWQKAIEMMYGGNGIFVFEYKGWTFLAGIKTEILFGCKPGSEKEIEKCHVDKLVAWGQRFNDIQLYQHDNRSAYFNAFYRVLDGKIEYGEYETESYQTTYGTKPDGIIKMPGNEACHAAGVWSIDPDTLRFEPELKNAKASTTSINY